MALYSTIHEEKSRVQDVTNRVTDEINSRQTRSRQKFQPLISMNYSTRRSQKLCHGYFCGSENVSQRLFQPISDNARLITFHKRITPM